LLAACLRSLSEAREVIVVDNASSDGSAEMVRAEFPHVVLIEAGRNVGFGAACNLGAAAATQEIVLFLNSDATALPGSLRILESVFSDPGVVAAGGRLQFPDGKVQASCCAELTLWRVFCEQTLLEKLLPMSRFFNGYWLTRWLPSNEPSLVAQVMGACLAVRRGSEPFDNDFFLYVEDTELCKRLSVKGSIVYEPRAIFSHELGASTSNRRWWSVAMYNRGKEMYFAKHHGKTAAGICFAFNRLGAFLRLLIAILQLGRGGKIQLFWRVLVAPASGPPLPDDSSPFPLERETSTLVK
jgi:N-acetylglucosaminyl-diphospho-decaprenol L-rhamnosyltransferase